MCIYISREELIVLETFIRKKNMEILDFYLLDVEEEKISDKQIISTLHFLDISE